MRSAISSKSRERIVPDYTWLKRRCARDLTPSLSSTATVSREVKRSAGEGEETTIVKSARCTQRIGLEKAKLRIGFC